MKLSDEYRARTVREMNWLGTKNGALLRKPATNNFDVLIIADRNMYYRQDIRDLPVAVLVVPVRDGLKESASARALPHLALWRSAAHA